MSEKQKQAHARMLAALPVRTHLRRPEPDLRGHQLKRGGKRGRALKMRPDDIFDEDR